MAGDRIRDNLVDIAVEQTFPASDPPCFMTIRAPRPSYTHFGRTSPASNRTVPSSRAQRSGNRRGQQSTKTWRPA